MNCLQRAASLQREMPSNGESQSESAILSGIGNRNANGFIPTSSLRAPFSTRAPHALMRTSIAAFLCALAGCANLDKIFQKNVESSLATAQICQSLEYSRKDLVADWKATVAAFEPNQNNGTSCEGNPILLFTQSLDTTLKKIEELRKTGPNQCRIAIDTLEKNAKNNWVDIQNISKGIQNRIAGQAKGIKEACEKDSRECAANFMLLFFEADSDKNNLLGNFKAAKRFSPNIEMLRLNLQTVGTACNMTNSSDQFIASYDNFSKAIPDFLDDNYVNVRSVLEVVLYYEIADAILTHLNRSLKGTEQQINKLDDKLYGAISASNLLFESTVQDNANELFKSLLSSSDAQNSAGSITKTNVMLSLAASSCRRLLRDVDPSESQYLLPYVLRAIVIATKDYAKDYQPRLKKIAALFSCKSNDDTNKEQLKRIDTAIQLRRDNSYKQLATICDELKKYPGTDSSKYVYCAANPDDRNATVIISPRTEVTHVADVTRRIVNLIAAHGLRLEYELYPQSLCNSPGNIRTSDGTRSASQSMENRSSSDTASTTPSNSAESTNTPSSDQSSSQGEEKSSKDGGKANDNGSPIVPDGTCQLREWAKDTLSEAKYRATSDNNSSLNSVRMILRLRNEDSASK